MDDNIDNNIDTMDVSLDEKIKLIKLDENSTFSEALFILQEFLQSYNVFGHQIYNLLDNYSGKIQNLNKYSEYPQDMLFMLLYISIMLYNDLANPKIINKIKLNTFIKMISDINNNIKIADDIIIDIYNSIYDKIKHDNIENNKLHDKKITYDKKYCNIL